MYRRPESELLVIGAGPTGLFGAIALRERGVDVQIVDEDWRTSVHSYALALHSRSLKLLDQLGLSETLIEKGVRIDTLALYDGLERRAEIKLSEIETDFPFALALPQCDFEYVLETQLRRKDTTVQWNSRVPEIRRVGEAVVATIGRLAPVLTRGNDLSSTQWVIEDTAIANPHFVIGADGYRSVVRRDLGFEFGSCGESELFGVFEFEAPVECENEVRVVLGERETSVLWPLPNGRCRWSFQLGDSAPLGDMQSSAPAADHPRKRSLPHLGERHLRSFIAERAPWFEAQPEEISWSAIVRFDRRLASRFGQDHRWLAGDAVHQTSPVGVQSMNVALREVDDLAERITDILRDRSSLESLERYNSERTEEWRRLLGLEGAVEAERGADPWVAANAERILPCLPASGEDLTQLLGQIGLALR